jgi:hypothetical protein
MRRGWRRRPPGELYSGMHACMRSGGGAPRPREGRAGREEMAGRQTASSFLFLSPLFPCTASFGMPLHCPFKRNADWDEFGVACRGMENQLTSYVSDSMHNCQNHIAL